MPFVGRRTQLRLSNNEIEMLTALLQSRSVSVRATHLFTRGNCWFGGRMDEQAQAVEVRVRIPTVRKARIFITTACSAASGSSLT